MEYWGLVAMRAWKDSAPWLDVSEPKKNIRRLVIGGVTVGILWAIGSRAAVGRTEWWVVLLAAAGAFALVVLLYNFLRAPDRIHREQEAAKKVLETRIEKRRVTQEHIDTLQLAYKTGSALLVSAPKSDAGLFKKEADAWSDDTAAKVKPISPNETWMFSTIANFLVLDAQQPAPIELRTRLGKLRKMIDRLIQAREAI